MHETTLARYTLRVSGLVQGVNFRWFTQRNAVSLRVVGFVRNLTDTSVEIVGEGTRDSLESLLTSVRQGPPSAIVENVNVEWQAPTGEFHRFEIRY